MDIANCRRAAIESLSENLTDGFVSPLGWYVVAGLPGLLLFKVVSTMDSMVGYKTTRYLKFGWCGARLDDVMNFIPARITFSLLSLISYLVPGCSGRKALRIGWRQHSVLPGPNSGWSEAATAGGIQRRLLGPIWARVYSSPMCGWRSLRSSRRRRFRSSPCRDSQCCNRGAGGRRRGDIGKQMDLRFYCAKQSTPSISRDAVMQAG